MSLLIGGDTKTERLLDAQFYDDIGSKEGIAKTKKNESHWDRQECARQERLLNAVRNPQNFVPVFVGSKEAVGLSFPNALQYKIMLSRREQMQFIQQWRIALIRCVTQTQWKIVNERYMLRIKKDPIFEVAMKYVLEDRDLLQVQQELPADRDEDDRRIRREGDMEREPVHWIMDEVPLVPDPRAETLIKGHLITTKHNKLLDDSRQWKKGQSFSYLDDTFPTATYSEVHGSCVVRQVTETVMQITYDSKDYWIEDSSGHGLLSCSISPNGQLLAICNEYAVYLLNVKDRKVRRVRLDKQMIITAIHITDTELVYGTVHGHVHRIVLESNRSVKTTIADKICITQIVRAGSKTVVQTIGSIYLVESDGHGPDQSVQVNTWRPMCIAVRGSKILVLAKTGALFMFSTVLREVFTEIPPPDGFSVEIDIGVAWYKGVWIAENSEKLIAVYPDGQIREIRLKV